MMTVPNRWKKSSHSGPDSNCVELGSAGGVRDSKNPSGPQLRLQLEQLVAAVKAGRITR